MENTSASRADGTERVLKNVFGYDSFRPLQKEIIENVLCGKDTLAVMPTGGGKSLCYQIPALLMDGITVVVSPLISLMQDQVNALQENGVSAVFLNSSLERDGFIDAVLQIKNGTARLVYVSPEGLATQRTQDILRESSRPVRCITIDEAHCVSEWGHDFRPDYMEIAAARRQFPEAVCLALTATATSHVRDDIIKNLRMKNPEVFLASFNRENIFLEVRPKRNALAQVLDCINEHPDESGIIYCFSRKQVDQLTQSLQDLRFSVMNYHAGLPDEERAAHQEQFIRDHVRIMVATVAFGMGINKPNVRFVIHYDIPKSLEEYYQEIGRAGRDGLPSHALLLYSPGDIYKIRYFFDEAADAEKSEKLLQGMIGYATSRICRRRSLLGYFGETHPARAESESCCDICAAGPLPLADATVPAWKLMSCIIRTRQRFGAAYLIDVLLGSRQKRIVENGHNLISTWGIGRELSRDEWFSLVEAMENAGLLRKTAEYKVLELTADGKSRLATREKIMLPLAFAVRAAENSESEECGGQAERGALKFPKQKQAFILHKKRFTGASAADGGTSGGDEPVLQELKEWRKRIADEENVPPYVIFGDRTLCELAARRPATEAALLDIYGIGAVKAEKFGPSVLRILKNHS